jgi:LynF/TruF/PatF family peptide O-prenyltransferase
MALNSSLQQINLRERRLQFIRTHLEAFDVEPVFPIPLFEEAVLEIEGTCGVESSCKVEGSRLLAGRFNVCNDLEKTWPEFLTHTFKFLNNIGNRLGVHINRNSFEQFTTVHIGSSKIHSNTIGINLGSKLEDSSVMLYLHLERETDPEELVRTAIALDGGHYSDELIQVLIRDTICIGFELFFDGRSHVEICPGASAPRHPGALGNRGNYLIPYLKKHFSSKVNTIFSGSHGLMVSFSKAYFNPVLWFYFSNTKEISKYFLFNSLGNRIYDFCQSQSCITDVAVAVTEPDLENSRLGNFCFYYNQRDECQPFPFF